MWNPKTIEKARDNTKFEIREHETPISHNRFLILLRDSAPFRVFYNDILAASGYDAFLWENKPVTVNNLREEYECNLIHTRYLAGRSADSRTFRQYFDEDKQAVTFPNLGNDAWLVVPCPRKKPPVYTHIGSFVRHAGGDQINAFWRLAAEQMLASLGEAPRWLSTSGLGVFWVHARIDSRPKYYQTEEYQRV